MTAPSMGPSSAGSRFSTNKRPTHQIKAKGNIFSASITPVLGVYADSSLLISRGR